MTAIRLPERLASLGRRGTVAVACVAAAGVGVVASAPLQSASAATGCSVSYQGNSWGNGFVANLAVTNVGERVDGWTLEWDFAGDQRITQGWNGVPSQSGTHVTLRNAAWNAILEPNASAYPGILGSYTGVNAVPTSFTLNGVPCTGTAVPAPGPTAPAGSPTATAVPTPTDPPTGTAVPSATGTPTGTAVPPQPGPPGAPSAAHAANPFAGAAGYLNPDYAAQVRSAAAATGGTLGAAMARVADVPTAVWLDRIAAVTGGTGVTRTLQGHLDAALAQQQRTGQQVVATFVVYDLPDRDCAAFASNGELLVARGGLNTYRTQFIDPIARVMGDPRYATLRIVAIVEPDSLPNLVTNLDIPACAEANSSGAYVQGVRYALDRLHAIGNVYTYLDIAHSGWLGWDSNFGPAVSLIANTVRGTAAGVAGVDGFVSNTANYTPTEESFLPDPNLLLGGQPVRSAAFYQWNPYLDERDYATAMRAAFLAAGFPDGIGMLIDTSRNGWGGPDRPAGASASSDLNTLVDASRLDRRFHRGNWCNQPGGIGARPQPDPFPGFDAFLWVKPPGESDGTSDPTQTTPDGEGKQFDAMCDPNARSRYDPAFPTGALPGAPAAGHWFPAAFERLVRDAFPPL